MTQWHGGKGSTPRKKNDRQAYADNWDRIFSNKSKLSHDERGFDIINDIVSDSLIERINDRKDELYPVRASTHKKQYAEAEECKKLFGIAVWWSQLTDEWDEVKEIHELIYPEIKKHLTDATFYASDIVTINGPSRWVGPHIDTPHRFEKYNKRENNDICGIQVNIQDCYEGVHDEYFLENAEQHDMPKGSILFYNTRLMHSTMPMHLPKKRSILLINYLKDDIIDSIKNTDNVWSSNNINV